MASFDLFSSLIRLRSRLNQSFLRSVVLSVRCSACERKSYNVIGQGVAVKFAKNVVAERTEQTPLNFTRGIHSAQTRFGIEEFFPPGTLESQQPLPEEVKSGRSWRAAELRQKSNEDLHKLWYVLLKERNMLLTVKWEARRQEVIMPSPERLHKVKKSMAMIKVILNERKQAIEAIEKSYNEKEENLIEITPDLCDNDDDNMSGNEQSCQNSGQIPITI